MPYLAPPPEPAPVEVVRDIGGEFAHYRRQTDWYRVSNREVRLGECRSACTIALSLPRACVFTSSLLRFNQIFDTDNRHVDVAASDTLFRSYPAAVRARLGYLTRKYKTLSGSELISLGIRDCAAGAQSGRQMVAVNAAATERPVYVPPGHGPVARFLSRMKSGLASSLPEKVPGAAAVARLPGKIASAVTGTISKTITKVSSRRWFGAKTDGTASASIKSAQGGGLIADAGARPRSVATLTVGVVRESGDLDSPVRATSAPLPPPRPWKIGTATAMKSPHVKTDSRMDQLPRVITGAYRVLPPKFRAYAPLR